MKTEKIAVIFITSTHKKKAFNYGLDLAKQFGSKITLLTALYKQPPMFGFFETKGDKKHKEKQKALAEKSLDELIQKAEGLETPIKKDVIISDTVSKSISSYVNQRKFDLVILDHPKLSRFEESYFGNVVCELHKELNCPLLIMK